MPHSILITGGAGYIGSHISFLLTQLGYHALIFDDFVHNQSFSPDWATIIKGNLENKKDLTALFEQHAIKAVIHCAASIEVGESVKNPAQFYANNVGNSLQLLSVMRQYGVTRFIFSSSCAVYGMPQALPLTEKHPKNPINPYGKTKLMVEMILEDYTKAYAMQCIALRYFNAAGALPQEMLGEQHTPESHIIPLIFDSIHTRKPFTIFGTDYPTPDGTAIRDYVHVLDIAQAHVLALHYLEQGNSSDAFNLGTGKGMSVQEVIRTIEHVTGKEVPLKIAPRREGDPAVLVADATKAENVLRWKPQHSDSNTIIKSAYDFYLMQKKGL